MITYETLIKKLYQKKQKSKFMHKTKYGRELGASYGYDQKAHIEEYNRIKDNPDKLYREYIRS